mmetsp:Transcript_119786/g.382359  ORF Transcript_119786/g.382359 Transcript_119786/m.382359 type:complete len:316 (-) Transcript_119786:74-1021(-)
MTALARRTGLSFSASALTAACSNMSWVGLGTLRGMLFSPVMSSKHPSGASTASSLATARLKAKSSASLSAKSSLKGGAWDCCEPLLSQPKPCLSSFFCATAVAGAASGSLTASADGTGSAAGSGATDGAGGVMDAATGGSRAGACTAGEAFASATTCGNDLRSEDLSMLCSNWKYMSALDLSRALPKRREPPRRSLRTTTLKNKVAASTAAAEAQNTGCCHIAGGGGGGACRPQESAGRFRKAPPDDLHSLRTKRSPVGTRSVANLELADGVAAEGIKNALLPLDMPLNTVGNPLTSPDGTKCAMAAASGLETTV